MPRHIIVILAARNMVVVIEVTYRCVSIVITANDLANAAAANSSNVG